MAPNSAYNHFSLYVSRSAYTFVPTEGDRCLVLHRESGEIQVGTKHQINISNVTLKKEVFGIIGIISLAITDYVVVISSRELVGSLLGHDIYRATKFDVLPMNPDVEPEVIPFEYHMLGLLRNHLANGLFWFSYTWDLTRRLQAQWSENSDGKLLWELADDRFFWNKFLQSRLIDIAVADPEKKIGPFVLPILYGTFDIRQTTIKDRKVQLCLISRRSRYRAGTRYFRRGVDPLGHVANFNETEQILVVDRNELQGGVSNIRLSFVQVRGSVPLFWAEINNLRYKPELQVMELPDSENAMRKHLQELVKIYGDQDIVNLVNHKGHEQPLKEAFEAHFQKLNPPRVRYEYFDFHTECSRMRWDRISLLLDSIEEDLIRNGYFYEDVERPDMVRLQSGTIRTNCMDNLDRTNVAQSAIAKWMLNRQLRDINLLQEHESVDSYPDFMHQFRNMWADHADNISKAYSGTGALKTDFTRTGQRSYMGYVEDGANSVMRYLKNNFFDGPRQDGFDLFTGNWSPRTDETAPTAVLLGVDTRPLFIRTMPSLAYLSLFMICAGLTLPRSSDYSLKYWFILWCTLFIIALLFIGVHGIAYVSWPRLVPLTDLINYSGPGYIGKQRGRGLGFGPGKVISDSLMGTKGGVAAAIRKRVLAPSQEIELGTLEKKRVD